MNYEQTSKLHRLRTLHLFAGAGGGILADILLGHQPVCAVEIEPYCQQVLHARQKDGFLPWFPIFDDVKTFDGKPWRGLVEVVAGGFPCQDISSAGKGAGIEGERSGLWGEMARVVCEVRPRFVLVENSPMLTIRGLGVVLRDLAKMGYDAVWGVLGAVHAGAPHKRERIWIVAYAADRENDGKRGSGNSEWRALERVGQAALGTNRQTSNDRANGCREDMADSERGRLQGRNEQCARQTAIKSSENCGYSRRMQLGEAWRIEPDLGRVAYGVAFGVDRLKAIGNGQVPAVAALAWRILSEVII